MQEAQCLLLRDALRVDLRSAGKKQQSSPNFYLSIMQIFLRWMAIFGVVCFGSISLASGRDLTSLPTKPCIAVMASFPEELAAIEKLMVPEAALVEKTTINGIGFQTAEIDGKRFVFFLTGMSLVNAASSTQLALDRFNVQAVFFTGIAGGVNPELKPGDVVVPAQWSYHSEAAYFNETAPGKYQLADWYPAKYSNFGMIHPDEVQVIREGMSDYQRIANFPADPGLLALAKSVTDQLPKMTVGDRACQLVCGGTGVSGTVFCDNAEYRKWVFSTFKAECLDMESTAIAQVCWTNKTPCLIVRGLSDLAGGQTGKNEEEVFLQAAADHAARVLVKILQGYVPPPSAKTDAKPVEAAASSAK